MVVLIQFVENLKTEIKERNCKDVIGDLEEILSEDVKELSKKFKFPTINFITGTIKISLLK